MVSVSYPEQHTPSHVAPQKRQTLRHKSTHSCPSCSCTPEDTCRTPHTRSHLLWKRKEQFWDRWCKSTGDHSGRDLYLHTRVFPLLWVCIQAGMNKSSLPLSDQCSCVRRYCHCMCAYFHGLTGENKSQLFLFISLNFLSLSYSRQPSSSDWSPQSS